MKLKSFSGTSLAGYRSVTWGPLQPDANLILGRNGAGKSTLLQSLSFALEYLGGRRTADVFARTESAARLTLEFDHPAQPIILAVDEIRTGQGGIGRQLPIRLLQFVENRQPKNTVGVGRHKLRDHPMDRYPHAISEVKALAEGSATDHALLEEVIALCRTFPMGNDSSWEWIRSALRNRGPKRARPVSCGQFDLVAFCLDLVRLKRELQEDPCSVFVTIDNPDTYLHPACIDPLLARIREMLPDPQIFVASHNLKLLCSHQIRGVFWLSRDVQNEQGEVAVRSVRELDDGSMNLFFELYGDDVSSAALRLLTQFESPEYFKFLTDCALPAQAVSRRAPAVDPQLVAISRELAACQPPWTVLDIGAGHGDLLQALVDLGHGNADLTYLAYDSGPSALLDRRLSEAKAAGHASPESRKISSLGDAPRESDAIVLCNVCHEVSAEDLPGLLSDLLLSHLRRDPRSKLVIQEVELLSEGEAHFVMWTPEDYQRIFSVAPELSVTVRRLQRSKGVTLDASIISWVANATPHPDFARDLARSFSEYLPIKADDCLAKLERLQGQRGQVHGVEEALRQRRIAFMMAQVAEIGLIQRRAAERECRQAGSA